jgi:hypothetical protein
MIYIMGKSIIQKKRSAKASGKAPKQKQNLRKNTVRRSRKHTQKSKSRKPSKYTRKQKGGDDVGIRCFTECAKAAGVEFTDNAPKIPKKAPRDILQICANKCLPDQPLYKETEKLSSNK